jgi:hypothetical protein
MMVSVRLKRNVEIIQPRVFFSSLALSFQNDTVVIQQHQLVSTDSLVKPSMSRTLVYRTNKEFDKCAELLRNILTVQGRINKSVFFPYHKKIYYLFVIKNHVEIRNHQLSVKQIEIFKHNLKQFQDRKNRLQNQQ